MERCAGDRSPKQTGTPRGLCVAQCSRHQTFDGVTLTLTTCICTHSAPSAFRFISPRLVITPIDASDMEIAGKPDTEKKK